MPVSNAVYIFFALVSSASVGNPFIVTLVKLSVEAFPGLARKPNDSKAPGLIVKLYEGGQLHNDFL